MLLLLLRTAVGTALRRKTLALSVVILAVAAPVAYAITLTGDGTLVGTTGSDTIAAGNGNDTVWGLGGQDTISAGNGRDVIEGNGSCPKGVQPGDYPNGLPVGQYCEHGVIPGKGNGDTISAGNGPDVVYGGGGRNTIAVGNGNDTIYGGPLGDTIAAGSGNDMISLGKGSGYAGSTVHVGSGSGVIEAQNGMKDTIACAARNNYTVYADKGIDVVQGCATVLYSPEPPFNPAKSRHGKRVKNGHKHHRELKPKSTNQKGPQ